MPQEYEAQERDAEAQRGGDRSFARRPAAPLPFQFQIPLGGGPLGIAVPFGGYGSPLAFTVPLGGAAPPPQPATVAVPMVPLAAASRPRADDTPVAVAATDTPLYVAPSEAADEIDEAAIGEWVVSAAEDASARAESGSALIASLWRDWLGPLSTHAQGAFGSRERGPSPSALFNAFAYPESGRRRAAVHGSCKELFRVLARPGQAVLAVPVRRGDLLLRAALGENWASLSVVGSAGPLSLERLHDLGLRGEGYPRLEAGRYLHVIDLGPSARPLAAGFARRLCDRSGLVLPNTLVLRLRARLRDVARARSYSFYSGSLPGAPAGAPFADDSEQVSRQPAACTCSTGSLFHYAAALKSLANLVGVRASIKTRYGKLCCEGTATTDAHSVTYVNISTAGATLRWAQTGYGRARDPGSRTVANDHYLEIRGSATEYFIERQQATAPVDGSTHTYQLTLDKSTGKWTASYDGTSAWLEHTSPGWRNQTGGSVQWTGEILNEDDDMSGTNADKCEFRGCAYKQDGASFSDAALTNSEVHSDDNARWGVQRLSGTSFCIWDKAPNP